MYISKDFYNHNLKNVFFKHLIKIILLSVIHFILAYFIKSLFLKFITMMIVDFK